MTKLSKHFSDWELLSPKLLDAINLRGVPVTWYIPDECINALEDIRTYFNTPVICNVDLGLADKYNFIRTMFKRGICSDQECLEVGRKLTTQHRVAAFDITVIGVNPTIVGEYIRSIVNTYKIRGMGVNVDKNFIHIDWRNSEELIEWKY